MTGTQWGSDEAYTSSRGACLFRAGNQRTLCGDYASNEDHNERLDDLGYDSLRDYVEANSGCHCEECLHALSDRLGTTPTDFRVLFGVPLP